MNETKFLGIALTFIICLSFKQLSHILRAAIKQNMNKINEEIIIINSIIKLNTKYIQSIHKYILEQGSLNHIKIARIRVKSKENILKVTAIVKKKLEYELKLTKFNRITEIKFLEEENIKLFLTKAVSDLKQEIKNKNYPENYIMKIINKNT